jgi:transcriptional regulator with XRE-family HTH domain
LELRIGEKLKALRLASDLTQAELADRAGVTKGFISQLENDQTSVQIDTLSDLLEALGETLGDFFSDVEEKVVFSPEERIQIEGKGASKFELLIPGSTNNLMDPIMLELEPGERLGEQPPHPGEQFGFVIQGTATLRLDRKTYKIPRGHCFYFEAYRKHEIANDGHTPVRLLWLISPPQM